MNDKQKRYLGIYLLWIIGHIFILFGKDGWLFFDVFDLKFAWDDFFYFPKYGQYDLTEFLFFLIVPVLIYFAIKLIRPLDLLKKIKAYMLLEKDE